MDRPTDRQESREMRTAGTVFIGLIFLAMIGKAVLNPAGTSGGSLYGWYLLAIGAVAAMFSVRGAMLALLLLPSFLGRTVVKSQLTLPGSFPIPLYTFDTILAVLCVYIAYRWVVSTDKGRSPGLAFTRDHALIAAIIVITIVAKLGAELAASRISSISIRNSAMFYYPLLVPVVVTYYLHRFGSPSDFISGGLAGLTLFVPATIVLALSLRLGDPWHLIQHETQGGMAQPIDVLLPFSPPVFQGNLILLAMLAAAVLPYKKIGMPWKALLAIFLAFDVLSYLDRAMWIAIGAGIAAGLAVRLKRRAAIATVLIATISVGALLVGPARQYFAKQHHSTSEWRLAVWNMTFSRIKEHPLRGHALNAYVVDPSMEGALVSIFGPPKGSVSPASGTGSARPNAGTERSTTPLRRHPLYPHNSYLSLIYYGGIVGGGSIILLIGLTIFQSLRQYWRADTRDDEAFALAVFRALVAGTAYAAFNVVLESPTEAWTFWIAVTLGWWYARERTRKSTPQVSRDQP